MFNLLLHRLASPGLSSTRLYSHSAAPATRLPYFVPRNSNGNLPVYSDIRNNRTRYLTLIRNIDGHAPAFAQDLRTTLFNTPLTMNTRPKVEVTHGRDVLITGGRWKTEVTEWLKAHGF